MENINSPYSERELQSPVVQDNLRFLKSIETRVKNHGVFDHRFLKKLSESQYSSEAVLFTLVQIAKMVKPFTGALATLMGQAPDIESRFVLFDNMYEEIGRGDVKQSHPKLYQKMLSSLGIPPTLVDLQETVTSIRILNDALYDAVSRKSFAVGCAWLGYGGELTIPNNFPYLIKATKTAFPDGTVNMEFWGRHGARDQGHSDDATMLLALNMTSEDYAEIEKAVLESLTIRKMIWDEMESYCESGRAIIYRGQSAHRDNKPAVLSHP